MSVRVIYARKYIATLVLLNELIWGHYQITLPAWEIELTEEQRKNLRKSIEEDEKKYKEIGKELAEDREHFKLFNQGKKIK